MSTRRQFIRSLGFATGGIMLGSPGFAFTHDQDSWFMPDEGAHHKRTWMAFGASREIWGRKLLPEVRRNLALIASAIARFEPVSVLVREKDQAIARALLGDEVELLVCPLDDCWMRDTGPVFVVTKEGAIAGIDFNFNGWGKKQAYARDAKVAAFVTRQAGARHLSSSLVLEGGGIEVDGHGTAIMTESCVLNENRNPGKSKSACEHELRRLLGIQKVVWLPGIKGRDVTDGHVDAYARFVRPGRVVVSYDADPRSYDHAVTRRHLEILRNETDAGGRAFDIVELHAPAKVRPRFAGKDFYAGYLNYYLCNGAVIAPEFGDAKADPAAKEILQHLFPERDVVQINIDGIAAGGGGIHCVTQQEPAVRIS